jgi:2'-5' RNA ligase
MAYAVSVFFDEQTDRAVRTIWRQIEAAGISSFLSQGPFHPHLTLAIFERLDVDGARVVLASLAAGQPPLPVALPSVGAFPGGEGVVFLSATITGALLGLHRQVHTLLTDHAGAPVPYYLPERWNPHCSLARALTPEQVAPAVAHSLGLISGTIFGTLTQIGVIETPAEVELCRFDLC